MPGTESARRVLIRLGLPRSSCTAEASFRNPEYLGERSLSFHSLLMLSRAFIVLGSCSGFCSSCGFTCVSFLLCCSPFFEGQLGLDMLATQPTPPATVRTHLNVVRSNQFADSWLPFVVLSLGNHSL